MTRMISKMSLLVCALTLFVGSAYANEKCKECHAGIVAKHAINLHGKAGKSCDACHGGVGRPPGKRRQERHRHLRQG